MPRVKTIVLSPSINIIAVYDSLCGREFCAPVRMSHSPFWLFRRVGLYGIVICLIHLMVGFGEEVVGSSGVAAAPISDATESGDGSTDSLLKQAAQEYEAAWEIKNRTQRIEKFRRSQLLFEKVIEQIREQGRGGANAALFVNLGNASLQSLDFGTSIVSYRKALLLEPGNRQAKQNLAHARSLVPDWIRYEDESDILDSIFFWNQAFSPGQLSLYASIAFLMVIVLWAFSVRLNQPLLRNLASLPGVVWLVLVVSIVINRGDSSENLAVVIVPEIQARSADTIGAAPRFQSPLPNGAELIVTQRRDDWTQVSTYGGQTAWVPSSALKRVH